MRIEAGWIAAPPTRAVCEMLEAAGHRALFVGGCVRNALLGEPVADIDIATDARPETVSDLAKRAGLNPVPTGVEHGTVTVVSSGMPHEVTTFRRDVETDGRRAVVAYTDQVEEDARRRDLTMNALYADPRGEVIDPLGGLPDLLARRVRFIEDPEQRIREDYLRILRFFRFFARYGDPAQGLEPEGLAACAALSSGLGTLSRERVGAEMLKLLDAPEPSVAVAAMEQAGCLHPVLPGASSRDLPVLVHLEQAAGVPVDPIRRLAVLGGEAAAERLRLSRKAAKRLAQLRQAAEEGAGAAELGYRLGAEDARDALLLRHALTGQPLPPDMETRIARGAGASFPLRAADLAADYQGPALGARLRELEARWIASGFTLTREALLAG
jgi:poly(A) polymerase